VTCDSNILHESRQGKTLSPAID